MTDQPRAWYDANNVLNFRADVTEDEARELTDLMAAAFNAGLKSGYRQGLLRGIEAIPLSADAGRTLEP